MVIDEGAPLVAVEVNDDGPRLAIDIDPDFLAGLTKCQTGPVESIALGKAIQTESYFADAQGLPIRFASGYGEDEERDSLVPGPFQTLSEGRNLIRVAIPS